MVNPHLDKMNPLISRLINDLWRKLDFVMEQDLYYQYFPAILFTLILRRENLLKNVPYDIRENIVSENLVYLFDNNEIEKFIKYAQSDPRFGIVIKAVGYVNLYYAFYTESNDELKEITAKIDKMLGKDVLQTYKIEVEEMIS